MVHHRRQRIESYLAFADARMPVFASAEHVLRVVQMDGMQPVEPHFPVELLEHVVQASSHIVAAIPNMAGVQAHAHVIGQLHLVDDGCQLLEGGAHLAAFPGHGVQQHQGGLAGGDHLVQGIGHIGQPLFHGNAHAAARAHQVQRHLQLG